MEPQNKENEADARVKSLGGRSLKRRGVWGWFDARGPGASHLQAHIAIPKAPDAWVENPPYPGMTGQAVYKADNINILLDFVLDADVWSFYHIDARRAFREASCVKREADETRGTGHEQRARGEEDGEAEEAG